MAANLRDFALTDYEGKEVKGLEVLTRDGVPVAYASCPTETHHLLCSMVNLWIPCVQAHNLYEFSYLTTTVNVDECKREGISMALGSRVLVFFKAVGGLTKVRAWVLVPCRHRVNQYLNNFWLQGISFFHSGDEMLHSKSLDCDSYSSGDWMNGLDFTYNSNYWGVGHPPEEKNGKNWPLLQPGLADQLFKPQKNHILAALNNFSNLVLMAFLCENWCS
nr:pullulanase 1, chloroplastic-like isoform X2 [Ziziphus jujuba var. spinosa]